MGGERKSVFIYYNEVATSFNRDIRWGACWLAGWLVSWVGSLVAGELGSWSRSWMDGWRDGCFSE